MINNDDEYYKELIKLVNSTEAAKVFVLDGALFKGETVQTIKEYLSDKSTKKFRTWLIDNNRLLDDSFDEDFIESERTDRLI